MGQTVSARAHTWRSRCGKSAIWRSEAACHFVTRPCQLEGSDAAVAAGWQFHPVTRAHSCKEQRSGVTTQDRRAPPARATNPRTGGRLTQRPAGSNPRTGQAAVLLFLHCRHLRVHPRLWRFRVRGRMRQCYNGLGLGISVLDGIGMVYRVPIFLFRSSPSLSSSVRLYFSLPIAAPRAQGWQ